MNYLKGLSKKMLKLNGIGRWNKKNYAKIKKVKGGRSIYLVFYQGNVNKAEVPTYEMQSV